MDAKYNEIADDLMVRAVLIVIGFSAWLAISVGLMALA